MGTSDFAVPTLHALHHAGHEVVAVYTQPPRPAGRGRELRASPVERFARSLGLVVRTPVSLRGEEETNAIRDLAPDAIVVVAYGLLLPAAVLAVPRLGCLNVHASLLPRWRGAAPIQRAIEAGDAQTGVTIMLMGEGLDTGPMLLQANVSIGPHMTTGALHEELSALGAGLINTALEGVRAGTLRAEPQPPEGATYAAKITREDEDLRWEESADVLDRRVRALAPHPGASFTCGDERVKVLEVELLHISAPGRATTGAGERAEPSSSVPGTLINDQAVVACGGGGTLRLVTVQRPGRQPTDGAAFLRGLRLTAGARLA